MNYSLSAAAKAVGRSKSTVHSAIKTGRLSAHRMENGSYQIDASELSRVFGLNPANGSPEPFRMDAAEPRHEPMDAQLAALRVQVSMLEKQLVDEREAFERQLAREQEHTAYLRSLLQSKQTLALTHQPQEPTKMAGLIGHILGRSR